MEVEGQRNHWSSSNGTDKVNAMWRNKTEFTVGNLSLKFSKHVL